jgi:hypothetical protein
MTVFATGPVVIVGSSSIAATPTIFDRLRLFHRNTAGSQGRTVKFQDSRVAFQIRGHFDKTKSLGSSRNPVKHNLNLFHPTAFGKYLLQLFFCHVIGQTADKQPFAHYRPHK